MSSVFKNIMRNPPTQLSLPGRLTPYRKAAQRAMDHRFQNPQSGERNPSGLARTPLETRTANPNEQTRTLRWPTAGDRIPPWGQPGQSDIGGPKAFDSLPTQPNPSSDRPQQVGLDRAAERMMRMPRRAHSFGGGELGRLGVTPLEKQATTSPTNSTTRRLVDAITSYVDERLATHFAETNRYK